MGRKLEQYIDYARSRDGTKIAYMAFGSGPPLMLLDTFSAASLEQRRSYPSSAAAFYESLSERRTVILSDWRNCGLSGSATDFRLETFVDDLLSLADHLDLSRFDLW